LAKMATLCTRNTFQYQDMKIEEIIPQQQHLYK